MKDDSPSLPHWYWVAIVLLLVTAVGAWCSPNKQPTSILNPERPPATDPLDASVEDLTENFRVFRAEVSQLSPEDQREVWRSLKEHSESLAEETMFDFFALPPEEQQGLIDRTIDRIEWRRRIWQSRMSGGEGHFSDASAWRAVREVASEWDYSRSPHDMSLEERLSLRRDLWTEATAQAIAMRVEFSRMLNERRRERNIPRPVRTSE